MHTFSRDPQVYTLYCVGCVSWTILYVPHFHNLDLSVLTSLMNLVGTSLFLLQAFRVNSSYGAKSSSSEDAVPLAVIVKLSFTQLTAFLTIQVIICIRTMVGGAEALGSDSGLVK